MATTKTSVKTAAEAVVGSQVEESGIPTGGQQAAQNKNRDIAFARNVELIRMRVNGSSLSEIAERFQISETRVAQVIRETLSKAENFHVTELRAIENARLDVAQSSIWKKVERGDVKAVEAFLHLSARRAKMNGLDAPQTLVVAGTVRIEMEEALGELERLLNHDSDEGIIDAEVVEPHDRG